MPGRALGARRRDALLPGLEQALDPAAIGDVVTAAAGLRSGDVVAISPRVLSHKRGQRCTIHYRLERTGGAGDVSLVGKLYRRCRLAARIFAWTIALSEATREWGAEWRVPVPLHHEPELGLVLQEWAEGLDLRHSLGNGAGRQPLALAARWLAHLHRSAPLEGLRLKPLGHELDKVEAWGAAVSAARPRHERREVDAVTRRLLMLGASLPEPRPTIIHRDFYYAHVLWDGGRASILDLDQLSVGDPALDVAHFLAHLDNLALRRGSSPGAYGGAHAAFLGPYGERTSLPGEGALRFYRGYTYLKLAATEVERRERDWPRLAGELTCLAGLQTHSATGRSRSTRRWQRSRIAGGRWL